MIYIGTIQSVDSENNIAIVYCTDIDAVVECMILQTLGNAGDKVYQQDEQVAIYMQNGRNLLLGAVYSKHITPNFTELWRQTIEILKSMKVSTGQGPSGTPLPDVIEKIQALENDLKTFLNVM